MAISSQPPASSNATGSRRTPAGGWPQAAGCTNPQLAGSP